MPARERPDAAVAGDGPRRRLRRKTTVGQLALGVVAACFAAGVVGAAAPAPPLGDGWTDDFVCGEELNKEDKRKRKAVYLVTLPHPRVALGLEARAGLRPPGDLSREDIARMFVDVFRAPEHVDPARHRRGAPTLTLERLVVFREPHRVADTDGRFHDHYHVALVASNTFRFAAYKNALRTRYKLASHWSCSHDGYWSAVRYGVMPSPKKTQDGLDATPLTWCRRGEHPSLFDSAQEPTTAAALQGRREHAVKKASAEGNQEPRATEMDLYPIIVRQGFRNTPEEPWAEKKLILHLKTYGSPALVKLAWKIRSKLSSIIDDVWAWDTVGETLAALGQSRLEALTAAAASPCVCDGDWHEYVRGVFAANHISEKDLCRDVYTALVHGRSETMPVVVLAGARGGEGKSIFLKGLWAVFGRERVFAAPDKGGFPLLGLESAKVAFLDEWRFNASVLPYAMQCLWYDGSALPIVRPQNIPGATGHLLYQGKAPIFVTTKYQDLDRLQQASADDPETGLPGNGDASMILRRLKIYRFSQRMVKPKRQLPYCGRCFARLVCGSVADGASQGVEAGGIWM